MNTHHVWLRHMIRERWIKWNHENVVYCESRKRELTIRPIYGCRWIVDCIVLSLDAIFRSLRGECAISKKEKKRSQAATCGFTYFRVLWVQNSWHLEQSEESEFQLIEPDSRQINGRNQARGAPSSCESRFVTNICWSPSIIHVCTHLKQHGCTKAKLSWLGGSIFISS